MQRVICTYVHSIKKSSVPLYIYEVKLNTDALGHEMYVKLYIDRLRSKLVCVFYLAKIGKCTVKRFYSNTRTAKN